ncbi:monovalent cation/H(+) antiporter subunit G [Schaalia hyovaginalis]|uniref:Multicomponent Na+:H+ antiporter subunit G n=1 Tax=Schaalia hyovaginalis TaxID=29316 RepID=A0A923E6G8_9ACTO|nr:monovalent cation/H(+) antiporter subunit G [Schaalia hyovaginalis]MBB6335657.1 multicomponent Na+:H+ antiporter subunit G [Schaalia hyovaginalis]
MDPYVLLDVAGLACVCLGVVFTFIASIGMVRYRDILSRQHVATKPQIFSLIMYFLGIALLVREPSVTWTMLLVIAFQIITAPISAHMLSRAAYRTGRVDPSSLADDALGEDLVKAEEQVEAEGVEDDPKP